MSLSLRKITVGLALIWAVAPGASAEAQGFGLGPRWSFVRGDVPSGTPSVRFFGGTMRIASSKRVVLEAALDYRSQTSEDRSARLRQRPLQGSILVFPVRSTVAPYLLGGYGLYSQTAETLDATGKVLTSESSRTTGAHMGFGAEVFLGKHAALFLDYRYRFVRFGEAEPDADPIDLPIPGVDKLKLSHKGTMWTSGVAFYF